MEQYLNEHIIPVASTPFENNESNYYTPKKLNLSIHDDHTISVSADRGTLNKNESPPLSLRSS